MLHSHSVCRVLAGILPVLNARRLCVRQCTRIHPTNSELTQRAASTVTPAGFTATQLIDVVNGSTVMWPVTVLSAACLGVAAAAYLHAASAYLRNAAITTQELPALWPIYWRFASSFNNKSRAWSVKAGGA